MVSWMRFLQRLTQLKRATQEFNEPHLTVGLLA